MDREHKITKIIDKKIFYYAAAAFVISGAVFASFFIVSDFGRILAYIAGFIRKFIHALTPLIIGLILAYLFNKPVMLIEKLMGKLKYKRVLSIAIVYIIIAGIIFAVINFIVPSVQQNLVQLINHDLPRYTDIINDNIQKSMEWIKSQDIIKFDNTKLNEYLVKFSSIYTIILNWFMGFAKGLTQGILNFAVAMVLAFYLLQNKEKILNSLKELVYLYCGIKLANVIVAEGREINEILGGYISGIILDAIIVFILMSTGLRIIGHKYFILAGATIGVLNIIPYFGSLIGCTTACLLALIQGVPEAIYTLITLIILQQIDGNVIQPKIMQNKIGLEPLWVISAVLVFGSFWGILGMLIAVPFTALLKAIAKRIVARRRIKNDKVNSILPEDTD